jgi:ribosomal protein S18 acetylase RimI-like enzyme
MPTRIAAAETQEELRVAQGLLREYWHSFGFDPSFQNFDTELADLPGKYAPPKGRLALAFVEDQPAGCVALRPVDECRGEAKRLYVQTQFRGRGVGQDLLNWLISEARSAGYRELVCDTMPSMQEALKMYRSFGFERIGPYAADPTPGAIYLSLSLHEHSARRSSGND